MDRTTLLRKIRACLRLSESNNAHEAAAALRQAQRLMAQHGIDASEVAGIEDATVSAARRGKRLPESAAALASLVARAFRCRWHYERFDRGNFGITLRFIGKLPGPAIAVYAHDVLRRQMDAACKAHIALVRVPANRKRRGEAFRVGWVCAVADLLPRAPLDEAERAAITAYQTMRWPTVAVEKEQTPPATPTQERDELRDRIAGLLAGKNARYSAGVGGSTDAPNTPPQLPLFAETCHVD